MEAKIIAIANQKGGVGKTTTSINLATALSAFGLKVLLIDSDPQSNATSGVGANNKKKENNLYSLLVNQSSINDCITKTAFRNLDIITSDINMAAAEIELFDNENKEIRLKNILEQVKDNYGFIIIDCPPSLGLLTINALSAAHSVLIPLQCEYFALEGLAHLLNTIKLLQRSVNNRLKMEGILLTMVDRRNRLTNQVEEDVRSNFGDLVYETIIPRNVKLSEAPSHGMPAIVYDSKCLGSVSYMMVAKELLTRHNYLNKDNIIAA